MSALVCKPQTSTRNDHPKAATCGKSTRARRTLTLCVLSVTASACGDPLVARELVTSTRVLGARVEATAATNQAWVAPTQSATVRWLVAGPLSPPALSWAFWLCAAEPVSRGLPRCAAPVFSRFDQTEPSTLEPRFEFAMPDEEGLDGASQVNVNGAFCETGLPSTSDAEFDTANVRCPDRKERPLLATIGLIVARDGNTNNSPSFEQIAVTLDTADWAMWVEPEAQEPSCSQFTGIVPTVKAGTTGHVISLRVPSDLSEALETVSGHSAAREALELSHYVTAGDLERSFSDVDSSNPASEVKLGWDPPSRVSDEGQLVRFFFVLRDGRGGADWSRRALCVVP